MAANPLDELDEAPSAGPAPPTSSLAGAPPPAQNPLDELDEATNPLDSLEAPPASAATADRMKDVTDQAQMPTVTVSARRGPESSWSDVAAGIPTAIGAGIESKAGGAQEFIGHTGYDDARKKFWQASVLPDAVRAAQKQGVALTDLPQVQDAAKHLGIRVDTFTRDWPTYANQTPEELKDFQTQQRDRIQAGAQQIASGTKKRLTAQQVQEAYAPNMDPHSLKALVFDTATMIPDVLAGVGGAVGTGGVGGAAIMAADIAPAEYSAARNRGLNHNDASTYAVLSTLASSVPEVPVLKIVEDTPLANKIIGSVIGEKLASSATGKAASIAAAQGVTQSVVNALQQGIDAGALNEHLPLDEALKQIAWSGLVGGVVGAGAGGGLGLLHGAVRTAGKVSALGASASGEAARRLNQRADLIEAGLPELASRRPAPGSSSEAAGPADLSTSTRGEPAAENGATEPQAPSVAPPSLEQSPNLQDDTATTKTQRGEENNSAQPSSAVREALEAVRDKTVTPPQADMLEQQGLIKRNDLNEPRLLPAGRRRLVQLSQEDGRNKEGGNNPTIAPAETPVQDGLNGVETGVKPPVSPPEAVPEPPKAAEVSRNEPESVESTTVAPENEAPAVQNRLSTDQDLRQGLEAMKAETGWSQVGGRVLRDASTDQVTGRTSWIPNAEWWPGRPKGLKENEVHTAVDKALSGQPLRKREQAVVDYMSQVHDERVAMASTHEELAAAVPDLRKQPEGALDLTLLASRAAEHDPNAAAAAMDLWEDDRPETIARVRGEFERIIGRGQEAQKDAFALSAQEGRAEQPAPVKRSPAALDLFGDDRSKEQALADESRRRDQQRSPNRDVPVETGVPGDLFSQARRQVDLTDQLKAARKDTETAPTDAQKAAGNYAKGELSFGGMKVTLENPKGSTRSGVDGNGKRWSSKLAHDYGYINRTEGADGDHVDAFLTGKPDTGKVYVVNQVDPKTGHFDEHKAVLGADSLPEARATYAANYPKGWKGEESIAEMTTPEFHRWVHSDGPARGAIRPPSRLERRTESARRKKVAEMTAEEAKRALLTHELTDIPNRRAYEEAPKLPHQVSIDVDSLKWVNDNMGHKSGDELLKAIASSLSSHTDNVFHLSGDEFAAQAHTETEAHELMRNVADHLKDASIEVEMPDGRLVKLKGMGVSYGVGKSLKEADEALQSHKNRRQAEGTRAGRGEAPPGATVGTREAGREDQAGGATEGVEPKFARRTDAADKTAVDAFANKVKEDLGLEDFTLRALPSGDIDLELLQVPRGERNQGLGTQAMQRLTKWADANGRRVTLALADRGKLKDWGTTSAERLRKFYSQFGFVSNKGRSKDFALSMNAHMYREPREVKSRRTEPSTGIPRDHVERIVHNTVREAGLAGFPHVEVHQDASTLPQRIQDVIRNDGAEHTTGAVYDPASGRIHLIADNNGTEQEVRENLWHEAVGHHGLRMAMDGPQYNVIMDSIARDMPERVEAAARRNGLDLTDRAQKRAAAEEVIAYAAGQHLSGQPIDKPVVPYWTRAVRAVKSFFARMTGKPFYDDKAIAGLIQQAHRALEGGAAGTVPGEPLRSTRAPTYYSPVERAVTESKQGKASAEQWLATIKKGGGIKPEELEWLNLEPWLKSHSGPITKEELGDYVRANKLNIEETAHGGGGPNGEQTPSEREQTRMAEELRALGHEVVFDEQGHLESIGVSAADSPTGMEPYFLHDPGDVENLPEPIRDRVLRLEELSQVVASDRRALLEDPNLWDAGRHHGTQYGDYTLPGGENYRELLLRLPEKEPDFSVDDFFDRMAKKYGDDKVYAMIRNGTYRAIRIDFDDLLNPQERQELATVRQAAHENNKIAERQTYRSGHWREKNIVAHTRFNERTDADGKKVLHLEEIQSDWHQAGRNRGYRDPSDPAYLEAQRRSEAARAENEAAVTNVMEVRRLIEEGTNTPEDVRAASRRLHAAQGEEGEARAALEQFNSQPPSAPFKTSWPMLTMKRMIRWAAENGFDRISWTTGAQQNERYNLANHIDHVMLQDNPSGGVGNARMEGPFSHGTVLAFKDGHSVLDKHVHDEAGLHELLGKELAEKLLAAEPRQQSSAGINLRHRELKGLDIEIGGSGMKGFYDQILPRETDKLIKKYGAKVGRVDMDRVDPTLETERDRLASEVTDLTRRNEVESTNPSLDNPEIMRRMERITEINDQMGTAAHNPIGSVHGFDITPQMRQAALGEGFPMFARRQQPLPLQQPKGSLYDRIRGAVHAITESTAVRDVRKLINPAGMSQESRRVAEIARVSLGELAHETVKSQEALEQFSRVIDKTPIVEQLAMMDAIEKGDPQPDPAMQPVADSMRKMLDTWRGKVQGLGEGYLDNFIENYFPHYWQRQDEAQRMVASIMGRRPLRGPASFLKMRTIPSIKEGMDAGLTPLTTNPLIMTLLKTREMQRFVSGVTLMRRFKEDGLAQFLPASKSMPDGWGPINDNIAKVRQWSEAENGFIERGQYIMPIDAARVINNHVSPSALRDFVPAQIIRRGANALNAMQLGFSAFHLGFTTLDAMISKNAQGIERLLHGEVGGAIQSFAEGLTPVGAFTNVRRGYKLLHAYSDPAGATPDMKRMVQALEQAGGRAHMDRYYQAAEGVSPFRGVGPRSLANDVRKALTSPTDKLQNVGRALGSFPAEYANKLMRGMEEIWRTTPAMEVPVEVAMRVVRASTSWIMEHLVPMQKLGVFSDLAADHLRRHPIENPNDRAESLQRIWASVDNRLGEMVYDNLFWNRTFKDSMHLAIRAVGWNVGTVREIGGAPIDIVKAVDKLIRTGKITADDLGHRVPYVISMVLTTALYSSIRQYMATGQGPQELKDYFFPRTGGVTNYGTPARDSLPSYVKDVYEYTQRPGQTVVNKLNPIFSVMGNLYSNQDFFGNPITDPEASYWHQKLQQLQFVGKEATPFSLQGSQQAKATETGTGFGAAVNRVLPLIGITPAPGYITSGEQMERRKRLEDDKKYTSELKYQMKKALSNHDRETAAGLAKEYTEAVKRMAQTQKLVDQDRAKAAVSRRKAATTMRQSGFPATANLVATLPLEPDAAARQYFANISEENAA